MQYLKWIKMLLAIVEGVISMLSNQQHCIDIELAIGAQGFADRLGQLNAVSLGLAASDIDGRILIDEQPHDLKVRLVVNPFKSEAIQEPPTDMIRVRIGPIDRRDHGDSLGLASWLLGREQFPRRQIAGRCQRPALVT